MKSTRGKRRINATSGDDDATSTRGGGDLKRECQWWWLPTSDTTQTQKKDVDEFDAEKDAFERYSEVMLGLLEEAEAAERRGEKCVPVAWL